MTFPPELKSGRLSFTPWREGEEETFHRLMSDTLVEQFMGNPTGISTDYRPLFARLLNIYRDKKFFVWAARVQSGEVAVHIELKPTDHCKGEEQEVVYLTAPEHRGKGLAFEALQRVMAFAGEQSPPIPVVATVDEDNAASRHLLGKAGFVQAGVLRDEQGDYLLYRHAPG